MRGQLRIDALAAGPYGAAPTTMASPASGTDPRLRYTNVAVFDSQPLFRDATCRVIRQHPQLQLGGEASDAPRALALLRNERLDVAIVDVALPGLSGERLLTLIAAERLATRLIVLLAKVNCVQAYDLLALGAATCLLRTASADDLARTVVAVADDRTLLADEIQHALVTEIRLREHDERPRLSPREHEVLRRVAEGQTAPAIGKAMHLSASTVKTHLTHLYDKLEVSDRAAAVAAAMRRGLIE
jgi:two-component system, NarL family, nitrate/nitrite response regulator NarL